MAKRRGSRAKRSGGGATEVRTWWRPKEAEGPASKLPTCCVEVVPALVEAKVAGTRLVRALDACQIPPPSYPGLPEALADLTQLDGLLLLTLHTWEVDPPPFLGPVPEQATMVLEAAARVRRAVLHALPREVRARVVAALPHVAGAAPEVWLELAGVQQAPQRTEDPDASLLKALKDEREVALRAFHEGTPPEGADPRVESQEARPLPRGRDVRTWLKTLPTPWLATIARMQRVPPEGRKDEMVAAIASALEDADALTVVLREGLGRPERELLMDLLSDGELAFEDGPPWLADLFEVPWDWSVRIPASDGGKLRAFGLAYVGARRGRPAVAVPPGLEASLLRALRQADPHAWEEAHEDDAAPAAAPEALARILRDLSAADLRRVVQAYEPMRETTRRKRKAREPRAKPSAPLRHYVLEVSLLGARPPVMRRLRVSGRRTLAELHRILQSAMGWHDGHLHAFEARDRTWTYADPQQRIEDAGDEGQVTLADVAPRKGSRFRYEYDFGDGWVHEIRVLERLAPEADAPEPCCLEGRGACPPEDCGGVWGYEHLQQALADPSHPEHEDMLEWVGGDFDAAAFDLARANARIASPWA